MDYFKTFICNYKLKIFRDAFANAELIAIPDTHAIPISENVEFSLAASVLLQGLTAHYLCNDSHKVKEGETILIHAASGGVGQILTQFCKSKGATVIGLSRSKDKLQTILGSMAEYASELKDDWKLKVMDLTKQKGVDVVFDSVGSTLMDSFEVVKDCGCVVFYGMSGGDPQPVDPRILLDRSISLTGGDLWSYLTSEMERIKRSNELFGLIKNGMVRIKEPVQFKLSEGKSVHEFLENGKSSSKILMIPD